MTDLFVRFFVRAVRRMKLSHLRAFGKCLGTIGYHAARKRRNIALSNLDLAYGDTLSKREKREIARACFQNLMMTFLEFLYSPVAGECFTDYVDLVKGENFHEANRRGKGVLVIVPHMGNWELIGRFFAWVGVKAHAVSRKQDPPWLGRLIAEIRAANGILEIDKRNALRPVLSALKRGETVNLLIDQHARKDSIPTRFFGHTAMTVASAALIALRTGCSVVTAASYRKPDGNLGVEVSPIIETIRSDDYEQDIQANTQRYVDEIEKFVRRFPHSWMWMHQRWRLNNNKPEPGEPGP
ncbi:MAG: hypothetical protein AMXMBFR75_24620 [Candidatus Hinthialibacteria bacterium]